MGMHDQQSHMFFLLYHWSPSLLLSFLTTCFFFKLAFWSWLSQPQWVSLLAHFHFWPLTFFSHIPLSPWIIPPELVAPSSIFHCHITWEPPSFYLLKWVLLIFSFSVFWPPHTCLLFPPSAFFPHPRLLLSHQPLHPTEDYLCRTDSGIKPIYRLTWYVFLCPLCLPTSPILITATTYNARVYWPSTHLTWIKANASPSFCIHGLWSWSHFECVFAMLFLFCCWSDSFFLLPHPLQQL